MKDNTIRYKDAPVDGPAFNNNVVIKNLSFTIGAPGVEADYNFAADANTTEQVIEFEDIIPKRARVLSVFSVTEDAFTFSGGATTLAAEAGSSSSGNQYITSATIYAAGAITLSAAGGATYGAPVDSVGSVYVAATPGANWSTMTAGKVTYYVTFIDVTGQK